MRANGSLCPFCSGHRVFPGFNDLATTNPALAAQAVGWDPSSCMEGLNEKRRWCCALGHEWDAIVASRAAGNGCAVCAGRELFVGFNDLATSHPDLATQADGWDPRVVLTGSKKKREWQCAKGHKWIATVASRTRRDPAGCPSCTSYGFSSDQPGYLYLIAQKDSGTP